MSKRQLIDNIREINTTAQPEFLVQFNEQALEQYLDHLRGAAGKNIRISSWVRNQPRPTKLAS